MSLGITIDAMIAAGCTAEQLGAVVRAHEGREEAKKAERRAKAAERQRRHRSRDVTHTERDTALHDATSRDNPPPSLPLSAPPMRDKTLPPLQSSNPSPAQSRGAVFDRFWQAWPNKVGKPAAERSFTKVAGELDAILAGLQRYILDKPPDRPWLNPSTFLNQRRWEDAPATVQPIYRGPPGSKPYSIQDSLDARTRSERLAQDRLKYA